MGERSDYRVRPADVAADRQVIHDLLCESLPNRRGWARKIQWFYFDCPFGPPLVELLEHRGQPVGVATVGQRRLERLGLPIRAGVLVDMAVSARHRAVGPAMMLQRSLISRASSHFDFLYGFPNRRAAAVFERCGHKHLSDLVRYVRVLRFEKYIGRAMPGATAGPVAKVLNAVTSIRSEWRRMAGPRLASAWHSDGTHLDIDDLWRRSVQGDSVLSRRTAEFIGWRVDAFPGEAIRILKIRERGSGQLVAWFACQADGGLLNICDFWSVEGARNLPLEYLEALVFSAHHEKYDGVSISISTGGPMHASLLGADFRPRGTRPIYGMWTTRRNGVETNAHLHMTAIDEDE